jgi:uncharacterized membrane protein
VFCARRLARARVRRRRRRSALHGALLETDPETGLATAKTKPGARADRPVIAMARFLGAAIAAGEHIRISPAGRPTPRGISASLRPRRGVRVECLSGLDKSLSQRCEKGGTTVQLPWYLAALGAAVAWGIHYPLVGFALKRVSLVFVLVLTALPIVLLAPFFYRRLGADLAALAAMSAAERWTVLALAATSLAGAVFLFLSIAAKNATLAALLEITYPVFVALFAWLLFREVHWNASVLAGSVLVFTGVAVIIWHNP